MDSLRLSGFGIAKENYESEFMEERVGTPLYMAPEVLEKKYDEKCDI